MKLLLDANLSWRMINVLKEHFDDCFHVDHVDLKDNLPEEISYGEIRMVLAAIEKSGQ